MNYDENVTVTSPLAHAPKSFLFGFVFNRRFSVLHSFQLRDTESRRAVEIEKSVFFGENIRQLRVAVSENARMIEQETAHGFETMVEIFHRLRRGAITPAVFAFRSDGIFVVGQNHVVVFSSRIPAKTAHFRNEIRLSTIFHRHRRGARFVNEHFALTNLVWRNRTFWVVFNGMAPLKLIQSVGEIFGENVVVRVDLSLIMRTREAKGLS